jgi:TolB protein
LIANFVEDQLPTWTADNQEIYFLSRRDGDRKSRLRKVGSLQTRSAGVVIGEGEYPTIGLSGPLVFRGWGSTGSGIRISANPLNDWQPLTDSDDDTAPALSPDGQKIAYMSRRAGNWEIYLINADGSDARRLTDNGADDGLPTWSPDGRAIAFVSNRGGRWAIWATTLDGNLQQELFAMEGSPDGFVGTDRNASRGWLEERISWKK